MQENNHNNTEYLGSGLNNGGVAIDNYGYASIDIFYFSKGKLLYDYPMSINLKLDKSI